MNPDPETTRRIFIVDDHPLVRDGIRAVLDAPGRYRVCGEATSPAQALRHLVRAQAESDIVDLMYKRTKRLDVIVAVDPRHRAKQMPEISRLTPRERTIFGALGQGLDKHHIAAELGIHVKTIETHREAIKHKLGVSSCRELVRLAVHQRSGN